METLQSLRRRLDVTHELGSVVRTMKVLAAASIRQFEKAADSLDRYDETVERGLQAALRDRAIREVEAPRDRRTGIVVFGSDQGMCGPFNEQIARFALRAVDGGALRVTRTMIVGGRLEAVFEREGRRVDARAGLPGTVSMIGGAVERMIIAIERWQAGNAVDEVLLFHNCSGGGAFYRQERERLFPIDREWLEQLRERPWPSRMLPERAMPFERTVPILVRQHFFVTLYRAFAHSLAAENAARLAAMQAAEKNVNDLLRELGGEYNRQRQSQITEELLDIVSGFEVIEGGNA